MEPAKVPFKELPPWAQEFAEHLLEGDTALFILHGQVFDYARVNGDYLPLRLLLAQWLGQERHVVFYNLGLGLEFWDEAAWLQQSCRYGPPLSWWRRRPSHLRGFSPAI